MKNKTVATWLAFVGGPLGLHRFYLWGRSDRLGWLLSIPTLMGVYGVVRAREFGLDDQWSWALIPLLGFTIAGCALNAIVFGLMDVDHWNQRFNPGAPRDGIDGRTNWFTIGALATSLFIGTSVLMATIAFSFQRYFEYQVEAAQQISQPESAKKSGD